MSTQVAPLLAVTLVFRSKTQFLDLPYVVDTVSLFLDTSMDVPPLTVCKLGSVRLLDRIWDSSVTSITNGGYTGVTQETFTLRKFLRTDKHYQQYVFSLALEDAVPRQDLEIVKWFLSKCQGFRVSSEIVSRACLAGSIGILQVFYDNDTRVLEQKGVIGMGNFVEWGDFTMSAAVQNRRSDILWWLLEHVPDANFNRSEALWSAVKMGDILIAEWLISQGAAWPERGERQDVALAIAARGRIDVLQWLAGRGQINGGVGLVMKAAENRHLEVVRWLVERNSEGSGTNDRHPNLTREVSLAIHFAAVNGHLHVAKYLREYAKVSAIALWRSLRTQDHLFEQFCSGTAIVTVCGKTMAVAAQNGHLDVVKWLYTEYGDDPDLDIFMVEEDSRYPGTVATVAMDTAASNGHLDVVKYLHKIADIDR